MNTHESPPQTRIGALERFLAFAALGLAAASILCFFAIIIGTAVGMDQKSFGHGVWPFVAGLPLFGLPAAFLMIIALLIISFVRKGRAGESS